MPSSDDEQAAAGPKWFPDPTIKSAADQRFVAHLRSLAPGWAVYGITPAHTTTIPLAVPFLGVHLPHLTTSRRWLWIKFFNRDDGLSLECGWGDDTYLDDWGLTDGDLPATSPDTTATPEQLAERAFSWVASQAGRTVIREEWYGLNPATHWSFEDSGAVLWATRRWPWRPRKAADQRRTERAAQPTAGI